MVIAKLIRLCMIIAKKILKVAAVVILCLVILSLIPNLPPYIEYNAYNVTPPVPLKGALSINTLLNNPERLYEGALKGPEAFDVYNGVLYTGLHGGDVVKFVDGKIIPVAKFGQPCEGFWEEKKCGRPLGIKFARDGFLYVADAYYGVFKVNVDDGTKIQLISVNDRIEDKPIKLPNSVDVAEDGTIYWTISSCEFHLEDGIFDMLADGSGRLLRYDPKKKTNEVLIDNLHFANGVVLSSNEEFVLVAETARSRIHRYYLKGPKKGVHDIFLDGLPGLPDNLKSDGSNGFFVPLVLGRDSSNPVLFQSLGPFPSIRRAFSRFLALLELFFWQIDSVYPNYYAERAIHFIGHFESMHGIGSKRITILHVDENGKIKSSYHSTDGKLSGISEIHWFNGAFYLGSPYNTYVGRVALEIPELLNHKRLPVKEDQVSKKQVQDQGQSKRKAEQRPEKRPLTEQKPPQPTIQQKHSAEDKRQTGSEVHQQKQFKEEKVPVKQQKQQEKEQSKTVQQPKQPLESDKLTVQQQKEQSKVQKQTQQQKSGKEGKPSPQQQNPQLQQSKQTVNEGKQSTGQQKPQSAEVPKSPVQQQKQQSAVPKTDAHQQKQQQQSAEVPKTATHQQQPKEVPKTATHQQQPKEVPKTATHQQQQQRPADIPKSTAHQQKQQTTAGVPKPAVQQQKRSQTAEVPKPAVQQQKQQQTAEVPKPAVQQQKQPQQKLEVTDKKLDAKQEKQVHEQKTVPHQKPQAKEVKPQVQQQKPVKEETFKAPQKEQPVKHKVAAQQQKSQPQEDKSQKQQQKQPKTEEQPVMKQQKKADQKAPNQKEPMKVQKASVQQPDQVKKPSMQEEKSSPQQQQPSETSHQKPKVQEKIPTKEQHPPK